MKVGWRFYWYMAWIRLTYALRLRWPLVKLQRVLSGEHKASRAELPTFETPGELAAYQRKHFAYRSDTLKAFGFSLRVDWISDPEVFQYKLLAKEYLDGDCDDVHYWAATILKTIPGVERVLMLYVGFRGGGHAVVVYKHHGQWWLYDYGIFHISGPNAVPRVIIEKYTRQPHPEELTFCVWETLDPPWKAVAFGRERIKELGND